MSAPIAAASAGAEITSGGVVFRVRLPDAVRVSVIGDFNSWDPNAHPLRLEGDLWTAAVPDARIGSLYKYRVDWPHEGGQSDVPDPWATVTEGPPGEASLVWDLTYQWDKAERSRTHEPLAALEADLLESGDRESIASRAAAMGFTHVALHNARHGEHAVDLRAGTPQQIMHLVEELHEGGFATMMRGDEFWRRYYHIDMTAWEQDDTWTKTLLRYTSMDPLYRKLMHDEMAAAVGGPTRAAPWLSLSRADAGRPLERMFGDAWQRHANVRLLFALQYATPGPKLIGDSSSCDILLGSLNHILRTNRSLQSGKLKWIGAQDRELSILRIARGNDLLVIANCTPVPRTNYRVGAPRKGPWAEVLNTDADLFGGAGHGNFGGVETAPIPLDGEDQSLTLTLPPLGAIYLRHQ